VGGVVGYGLGSATRIEQSFNSASVASSTSGPVGGVVGFLNISTRLCDCYNVGSVSTTTGYAGGVVGYATAAGIIIENCYASGSVTATGEGYAGAINGYIASANVTYTNLHYLSGIAETVNGYTTVLVDDLYKDAATAHTSKDLEELAKTLGEDVWKTDATGINNNYPVLAWQLPYTITYKGLQGEDFYSLDIPIGYTADTDLVSALFKGESLEETTVPTGYISTFGGWVTEENGTTNVSITHAETDVIVWPYFVHEAIIYSITYSLDNATNASNNPSTYTVESQTITLAAPTKQEGEFDGWKDSTGSLVTQITSGSTGNITLTASWLYDLSEATLETISEQPYSSLPVTPLPVVSLGGALLQEGTHYSVAYEDNILPGTAKITISGVGEYQGTITTYFTIPMPSQTDETTHITVEGTVFVDFADVSHSVNLYTQEYGASSVEFGALFSTYGSDSLDLFAAYNIELRKDSEVSGAYEAISDDFGKIKIIFTVGEQYNGRSAQVIQRHAVSDGTISETYFNDLIVQGGKITIEVEELSDFVVIINGSVLSPGSTDDTSDTSTASSPATGTTSTQGSSDIANTGDNSWYWMFALGGLALGFLLLGVYALLRRKAHLRP
jgi:LPXTG-motif cell wall-anchored protein